MCPRVTCKTSPPPNYTQGIQTTYREIYTRFSSRNNYQKYKSKVYKDSQTYLQWMSMEGFDNHEQLVYMCSHPLIYLPKFKYSPTVTNPYTPYTIILSYYFRQTDNFRQARCNTLLSLRAGSAYHVKSPPLTFYPLTLKTKLKACVLIG